MSKRSDAHEVYVSNCINLINGYKAERPICGTEYSDVRIYKDDNIAWLEVKMNHSDNLANPRVFYRDEEWQTTYTTPVAKEAVKILNNSEQARDFINKISSFVNIEKNKIYLPTTKSGLKEKYSVSLEKMKEFFKSPGINRYIHKQENIDLSEIVKSHYVNGKIEACHYLQAADDFYFLSKCNPLNIKYEVKEFSGIGRFCVRVSTRSEFYEIQTELKVQHMCDSEYSLLNKSNKINPLL